jgi:hypothetical protein
MIFIDRSFHYQTISNLSRAKASQNSPAGSINYSLKLKLFEWSIGGFSTPFLALDKKKNAPGLARIK